MKKHNGGLGKFLNEATQKSKKDEPEKTQITYIDIDEIETNPKNFYELRNIDELAGLIAVSHLIEPLTVMQTPEGKYKLISGHRRRAAVKKLLEDKDGDYTERKLPCIIKAQEKISIEQKNGETIEFDEEAVEMLNLIASNRGQRSERTIEEKLQEIKYLEKFARAIYNQKQSRRRGRFVNFFAEEILNISKSQLSRIISTEKLTENVRQAVNSNKISESAAIEMTSLSPKDQEECLKKILSGEIKGTVQDIQNFKSSSKDNKDTTNKTKSNATNKKTKESVQINLPLAALQNTEKSEILKIIGKIIGIPEEFDATQKEAEEWFYQEKLVAYESIYEKAKQASKNEKAPLKSLQWEIRASVVLYDIEELKIRHNESKIDK